MLSFYDALLKLATWKATHFIGARYDVREKQLHCYKVNSKGYGVTEYCFWLYRVTVMVSGGKVHYCTHLHANDTLRRATVVLALLLRGRVADVPAENIIVF
jgi:hypothetical protein